VQKNGIAYQVVGTIGAQAATWTTASSLWTTVGIILKAQNPPAYAILNATTAGANAGYTAPQSSPDYVDAVIAAQGPAGTGVLAGCAVSPNTGADFNFQVAAGTALFNWAPIAVGAVTAQAVTAANGSNPRRDLVYVQSNGTIVYVAGAAAAIPCIPTLPLNCIALAVIEVPTSATAMTYPGTSSTAYANDKRVMVGFPPSFAQFYLKPSAALFETGLGRAAGTYLITPGSAGQYFSAIVLPAGLTIGHLAFVSVAAGSGMTHQWFGLYDLNYNLLAATADATSAAWAANTAKSLAIATTAQGSQSSFTTTYSGIHLLTVAYTGSSLTLVGGPFSDQNTAPALSPATNGTVTTPSAAPPAFPSVNALNSTTQYGVYGYVAV
jgi:hypothetical protein